MAGFPGWQTALLAAVGGKPTPSNLQFLNSWQNAEGGGATYNPFNTTLAEPGATSYNSVGVRNYVSPQQGVQATLRTLQGDYKNYPQILASLRAGNVPATTLASYVEGSPWGTRNIPIAGASAAPVPSTAPRAVPQLARGGTPAGVGGPQQPAPANPYGSLLSQEMNVGNSMFGLPAMPADLQSFLASGKKQAQTSAVPKLVVDHGSSANSPLIPGIVQLAKQYLGTPYSWGGGNTHGPTRGIAQGANTVGFDCSAFVQFLYAQRGLAVPRTTYDQGWSKFPSVPMNQLQPGDVVFFDTEPTPGPDHEGLYIGNGEFIQSPHTGDHIRISSLNDAYYHQRFYGARRIVR